MIFCMKRIFLKLTKKKHTKKKNFKITRMSEAGHRYYLRSNRNEENFFKNEEIKVKRKSKKTKKIEEPVAQRAQSVSPERQPIAPFNNITENISKSCVVFIVNDGKLGNFKDLLLVDIYYKQYFYLSSIAFQWK